LRRCRFVAEPRSPTQLHFSNTSTPATKMAPFTLKEAVSREDHDVCMEILWRAQYSPYDKSFNVFYPVFGADESAHASRVKESKDRLWANHQARPGISQWLIVQNEKEEPVGACEWEIHRTNPFASGVPKISTPWWPEGEGREFAEEWFRQCFGPRAWWMHRPHLGVSM
jgi:hypothetical protein